MAADGAWKVHQYEDVLVECVGCEHRAGFCCAGVAYASHFALEAAKEAKDCFGSRLLARFLVGATLSSPGGQRTDTSTVHAQYRLLDLCWCTMHTLDTTLQHHQQKQ